MPSGSYVRVVTWNNHADIFLNVYVYPLREDAHHSTGLCGDYDLDVDNDRQKLSNPELAVGSYPACGSVCDTYR